MFTCLGRVVLQEVEEKEDEYDHGMLYIYIYGILKDLYVLYISSKVTINLAFW